MDFKDELRATAEVDERILGLVWAGSAAETSRFDEWSDYDFFLITHDDVAEPMRQDLSWLPAFSDVAFWARETAHGLKVVYNDATILEFAVFTLDELSAAAVNHYEVDYDGADVEKRTAAIKAPGERSSHETLDDHLAIIYTLLMIAIGRARRGERLIAGQFIRSYAPLHLIRAVKKTLESQAPEKRDVLDAWRRFEWEYPEIGARLNAAAALEVEASAWAIADLTAELFGTQSTIPAKAIEILQSRFGRPAH
jgi:hypothetical protein